MKTYNSFILENLRTGTEEITLKDAYNIMKKNCTEFIENPMNIFKGAIIDLKHYTFDSKKFNRPPSSESSASLLYHWVFNNSKYWQDYPKRSEAIIGSLSVLTAQGYGDSVFNVIPFDGSNWGICPEPDIWTSFDNRIDDLIDFTNDIDNYVKLEFKFHFATHTFTNFIEILKSVNKENFVEGNLEPRYEDLVLILLETKKNLYDVVEELLRPNMNNFMHLEYDEMFINFGEDKTSPYKLRQYGREVWTDSKCLYIPRVEKKDYKTNKEISDFMVLLRKLGVDEDKIKLLQQIY